MHCIIEGNVKTISDGYGREFKEYKCTKCGDWVNMDDVFWVGHNPYCEDCIPNDGEMD